MTMPTDLETQDRARITDQLVESLRMEPEIRRIVIFGSFLKSESPHDLDVAIYQESDEDYLTLAMKYRRKTRDIARRIPVDIVPLRYGSTDTLFLAEIEAGNTVYER